MKIRCGTHDEEVSELDARKLQVYLKEQVADQDAVAVLEGILSWYIRQLPPEEQGLSPEDRVVFNGYMKEHGRQK